jgi:3-hydroxybutyryl-CoA dehydrogenase
VINTVAVLGAGTMGHGIAQVCAAAGCDVRLYDLNDDAVNTGAARVQANFEKGIARGKVTEAEREDVLGRISTGTVIADAVDGADLVVEAAPELIELKAKIFAEVGAAAPDHAILASNTSSLSIGEIAKAVSDPSRFVGMHFFNPVHIMKLVAVVWGPETSDSTRDAAVAFAVRLGKEPIVVRDAPGFAPWHRARHGSDPHGRTRRRKPRGHRQSDGARIPAPDGSAPAHRPRRTRRAPRHRRVPARYAQVRRVRTPRPAAQHGC